MDLPQEWQSRTSSVSSDEQLPNTCRKDFSLLHFDDEQRVQERQQVKDQQFFIPVFAAYLTFPNLARNTCRDMTTVFQAME